MLRAYTRLACCYSCRRRRSRHDGRWLRMATEASFIDARSPPSCSRPSAIRALTRRSDSALSPDRLGVSRQCCKPEAWQPLAVINVNVFSAVYYVVRLSPRRSKIRSAGLDKTQAERNTQEERLDIPASRIISRMFQKQRLRRAL